MPIHASIRRLARALIAALALAALASPGRAQAPKAKPAADSEPAPATPAAENDAPDPSKVVLVSASDFTITAADLQAELSHQPGRVRFLQENPAGLRDVLDQMLRRELLAKEAARRGYDKHPAVVQATKEEAVQQLNRQVIDEKITPETVAAEDVKAFYERNASQFHRPAMRRARHILLEDQAQAVALLKEARKADEREFQRLAREHSIDTETKQRGGDLRFFTLADDPKRREAPVHVAIRETAFALPKVGDTLKKPVVVDERYSLVRLTGIRDERHTTLEQADASIRTRLWRQARRDALKALMQQLRTKYKPEVFADRIAGIDLSDVGDRPTGFAPDPAPRAGAKLKAKPEAKTEAKPAEQGGK